MTRASQRPKTDGSHLLPREHNVSTTDYVIDILLILMIREAAFCTG